MATDARRTVAEDDRQAIRIALAGAGGLGSRFLQLLDEVGPRLRAEFGWSLRVVAAADSGGWVAAPGGLVTKEVLAAKRRSGSVGTVPEGGHLGSRALEMVQIVDYDVLCEATPVHLSAGAEPGLSHVRAALRRGRHVVTPNKGPIVLAWDELHQLAKTHGAALRFDGTVAGGLPALYTGSRDLRGAIIDRIEAVPNLTTGIVLERLGDGLSWEDAVEGVRRQGALEADPTWDLDGWDAAAKLVILVRAVLREEASLGDVERCGIRDVSASDVIAARRSNETLRLVACAERRGSGLRLSVRPTRLSAAHPLGRLGRDGMGVVYHTDIFGSITLTIAEPTPLPSAATMLRDILDIYVR